MKVVYMRHGRFKNRGLRERPLTENGGGGAFRTGPHVKRRFGAKNNKQTYIFLKGGSFRAAQVETLEFLGAANAKNWGLSWGT